MSLHHRETLPFPSPQFEPHMSVHTPAEEAQVDLTIGLSEAQLELIRNAAIEVGVSEAAIALRGLAKSEEGTGEGIKHIRKLKKALDVFEVEYALEFPEHDPLAVLVDRSEKRGVTRAALAASLGIPGSELTRFMSGERTPSPELIARFKRALKGGIVDMIHPTKKPKRK